MDANEFLESARTMLSNNKEIDYRNAASRAYYGAFHQAKNLLEKQLNIKVSYGATHEKVIKPLQTADNENLRTLGNRLHGLKTLRNKADYHLNDKFSIQDAKSAVQRANKLVKEIEQLCE